jgi:carbon starvation protein
LAFGWAPALIWILIGALFLGGVHDYTSLVASIRNQGESIGSLCKKLLSPLAYRSFLVFILLTLIYVQVVFLDLTAGGFVADGAVATSSIWYILIALVFGYLVFKKGFSLAGLSNICADFRYCKTTIQGVTLKT